MKTLCAPQDIIEKVRRQPTEREKIFASDVTDTESASKIYQQLLRLSIIKTKNPARKRSEDLNGRFSKDNIQMAKRHRKRRSISLILREMQMKRQ